MAVELHRNRPLKLWVTCNERLAQIPIQFGIAGLPNFVTRMNTRKVQRLSPEGDSHFVRVFRRRLSDLKHAPAFFVRFRMAVIEYHSISRFQRSCGAEKNAFAFNACDFTEISAAFFSKSRMNQFLIVYAAEPTGVEATGKGHLELIRLPGTHWRRTGIDRRVQRVSVNARDVGHVFRRLEPAFDLQ